LTSLLCVRPLSIMLCRLSPSQLLLFAGYLFVFRCERLFLTTLIFWCEGLFLTDGLNKFCLKNLVTHVLNLICFLTVFVHELAKY
jgi:hypothetical protein